MTLAKRESRDNKPMSYNFFFFFFFPVHIFKKEIGERFDTSQESEE